MELQGMFDVVFFSWISVLSPTHLSHAFAGTSSTPANNFMRRRRHHNHRNSPTPPRNSAITPRPSWRRLLPPWRPVARARNRLLVLANYVFDRQQVVDAVSLAAG